MYQLHALPPPYRSMYIYIQYVPHRYIYAQILGTVSIAIMCQRYVHECISYMHCHHHIGPCMYIYIQYVPLGTYMPSISQILGTVSIGMHVIMLEVPSQVYPQVCIICIMISMVQYVQPIGRHLYIHKACKYSLRYNIMYRQGISLQYSLSIGRDTYYAL